MKQYLAGARNFRQRTAILAAKDARASLGILLIHILRIKKAVLNRF
jgi:hypothetical protein